MRRIFIKMLAALATAAVLTALGIWWYFEPPHNTAQLPAAERKEPPSQPDFSMLAERIQSLDHYQPTPEELEQEKEYDQEQVKIANEWLNDADPEQRVTGAEQLSAYPTPEAEKLLAESLANDLAPEVRAAAAESLDSFEKLEESTVQALMAALEDSDEDVRHSALGTLQALHDRLEGDEKPKEAKKILADLKKMSKSPRVPMEMQKEIRDYLRDLQ